MAADATGIREYKGAAKATTIVAGITNTSTSWSIADSTGWPTGSVGNFVATLEQGLSTEERILCSALAGGVLTVVTRGYDNTTAVAHAATSSINHTISAIDIAEANYIANFHSAPAKATPLDADILPFNDVAGGNLLKNFTWANLKATLLAFFFGYATTATAAGTSVLTVTSSPQQYFTGTTTQTITMPVASTLTLGQYWDIVNNSTGVLTVNSSGGNLIATIPAGGFAYITCILLSGTTAASWNAQIGVTLTSAQVLTNKDLSSATNTFPYSGAWIGYSPTATPQSGSGATIVSNGRYKLIGKICILQVYANVSVVGTGTGSVLVTLPFAASGAGFAAYGNAYNNSTAKTGLTKIPSGDTTLILQDPLGANWFAAQNFAGEITYEVA